MKTRTLLLTGVLVGAIVLPSFAGMRPIASTTGAGHFDPVRFDSFHHRAHHSSKNGGIDSLSPPFGLPEPAGADDDSNGPAGNGTGLTHAGNPPWVNAPRTPLFVDNAPGESNSGGDDQPPTPLPPDDPTDPGQSSGDPGPDFGQGLDEPSLGLQGESDGLPPNETRPMPAPGAVLLGLLGLFLVSRLKRVVR
jgi:hypothetical protein